MIESAGSLQLRKSLRFTAIGVLTGLLILGLGGRVVMVASSWLFELPVGLTLRGTLVVVVTGGIYGALGGVCYYLVERILPTSRILKSLILGTGWFLVIGVVSIVNRQTGPALLYPGQTIALFLPLAWMWAVAVVRLTNHS